ncbi:MAG: flagellar filament capping protein FliD [Rhodoferax sp.]
MAITSQGIGSGLDVNSIVSQLVAIEKQPLKQLQTKASSLQTQLSQYGTLKSQASTLGDAAAALAQTSGWNLQKATSSNTTAVTVSLAANTTATSLSVEVSQLAQTQSSASAAVAAGTVFSLEGTLSIQMGTWSGSSTALGFTPNATAAVDITVDYGDTITSIAQKINDANASVSAIVLKDGSNERLVVRSKSTGAAQGFAITASGSADLSQFTINDSAGAVDSTNSSPATGMAMSQVAQDATAKINGTTVTSTSNKLSEVVPGVTLQLATTTTSAVSITIEDDTTTMQSKVQALVDAYNALNTTLASATKYDASSKTGGPLQGDSATVGLQNALRSLMGSSSSGSTYSRLSDVGLERQTDGSLKLNATRFSSALTNLDNLKKLFTTDNSDSATNGFGLKIRDFARGLVAYDGRVTNKSTALQDAITRNGKEQDRVNERASRVETSLRKQYTALDAQMAQLTGLSSYVSSQVSQWNKTSS